MSRMSPGRQPSPPSTKPRRPTTQLSRVNTRPTSLCTTRSRGMTGSPGPHGPHPRSGHQSGARPAGRALRPEAARRCTPHRPSACTPWSTGLRYGSRCRARGLYAGAQGPPHQPLRVYTRVRGGSEILHMTGCQQKCRQGLGTFSTLYSFCSFFIVAASGAEPQPPRWETVGRTWHHTHLGPRCPSAHPTLSGSFKLLVSPAH